MKNLVSIEPIAVKDKNDVVKALTLLEKLGIDVMTDKQKENYLVDDSKDVNNNFMIQDDTGGFRIQSHYIGNGISIESLEAQVNDIVKKQPNIRERILEIENKRIEFLKELEDKKQRLRMEINKTLVKLENVSSVIELR